MPRRASSSPASPPPLPPHWAKALAVARALFEAEGYPTTYLREIETFLATTAAAPRPHDPGSAAPPAGDEDTQARVSSLVARWQQADVWCDDPQDPRRGTSADVGQVVEEIRQLVSTDAQAAQLLWATYAAEEGRGPEIMARHAAEAPASAASRYRIAHYPHSRFWAVYDGDTLVAVTVYRKGAEAVSARLEAQDRTIATLQRQRGMAPTPPP